MSIRYISLLCLFCFILNATKLPDPDMTGGKGLFEAAANRKSERDFTDGAITEKELSQLLWASYGYTKDGHRSVPSSHGVYPFDVYAFMKNGTYLYIPKTHEIELKVSGDHREVSGNDDFVKKASVNICFVGAYSKEDYPDIYTKQYKMRLDSGYPNMLMYYVCVSEGLKCVVRGGLDQTKILRTLGLGEEDYYVPLCFSAGR